MVNNYKNLSKVIIRYYIELSKDYEEDTKIKMDLLTAAVNIKKSNSNTIQIKSSKDVKSISDLASFAVQRYIDLLPDLFEGASINIALLEFEKEIKELEKEAQITKSKPIKEERVETKEEKPVKPIDIPLIKPPKKEYRIPNLEELDKPKEINYNPESIKLIATTSEENRIKLLEGSSEDFKQEVEAKVKELEKQKEEERKETIKTL